MGKFCPNCGAPQEAEAKFCAVCGESTKKVTEITTENMAINGTNAAAAVSDGSKDSNKNKLPARIITALIIVVILLCSFSFCSSIGGYKSVVNRYFNSFESGNFDKLVSCFPPEQQKKIKKSLKDSGYSKKEYTKLLSEFYGDDFKISYKITSKKSLDKYDVEDIEDDFKDSYNEKINISSGYNPAKKSQEVFIIIFF